MFVEPNDSTPRFPPEKMFVIPVMTPPAKATVPIKKHEVNPVVVIADVAGGVDEPVFSIVTT